MSTLNSQPHPNQNPNLIIGNKNYSSWSLRAWLALHAFDVAFKEQTLELFSEEFVTTLASYHANQKVPLLVLSSDNADETIVWDSLAIAEYINDSYLEGKGWGKHQAIARSLACEMHSGFFGVRSEMPMNIRATRKITPSADCLGDIARINHIFTDYRAKYQHEGEYLLGDFSLVDCFYAPVVFRFVTYGLINLPFGRGNLEGFYSGIELSKEAKQYCENMLNHPSMQAWRTDALKETSVVEEDEAGVEV